MNNIHDEIAHRILAANRAYHAFIKLFKNRLISKTCKLTLYKTLVRSIVCFNAETRTMTTTDENNLRAFERKILRKIFGPVKEDNNVYRVRYNEIMQLMENEDIVRFIKAQRLRWLGHIKRMDENKTPKRTYVHVGETTREMA